jgi:hypothetical protein
MVEKNTNAARGRTRGTPIDERILARLGHCEGLLTRAAHDLKVQDSGKLSRVLGDVLNARDLVAEILNEELHPLLSG